MDGGNEVALKVKPLAGISTAEDRDARGILGGYDGQGVFFTQVGDDLLALGIVQQAVVGDDVANFSLAEFLMLALNPEGEGPR